ncbi:alginate lyase family protein [Prolixibacter bellariivorans]|uniref:alginate lyase family protein n=1 Tax=Prolixibacter bellariivorans TaxID=314319 RepID=UPI00047F56E7|nr:alginate lyase family protein [Prolixibacter bellariivorans]
MDISKYYHTVKHLKPIQLRYQLWYRIRHKMRQLLRFNDSLSIPSEATPVKLVPWLAKSESYKAGKFTFLNISHSFPEEFDWNLAQYGKLWAYNLNYMDYLLQPNMDIATGIKLIERFIHNLPPNSTGQEPYPIALRGINWIKFLSLHHPQLTDHSSLITINNSLYAQYHILLNNLEYHLLGNHLLEDAMSLLYGAYYFRDRKFFSKAKKILEKELEEQILEDGGHFELSTMYHQILLDRLLDCINLISHNDVFQDQDELSSLMQLKAQKMLQWLNAMTFSNGEVPLLNDAAPGIAPATKEINNYAIRLKLLSEEEIRDICENFYNSCLSQSGYRRYNGENYECLVDIGPIGPSYQPGHAHADTSNFVLNVNNQPIIVDTGISTYDAGKTRLKERGTSAHNTVTVQDKDSSKIWSSFRVAKRAEVKIIEDNNQRIIAQHDGYKSLGTTHKREWQFDENQILINDMLEGKITEGKAHIWLGRGLTPIQNQQSIKIEGIFISFQNAESVRLIQTKIPDGYNRCADNYKIEIRFNKELNTIIATA